MSEGIKKEQDAELNLDDLDRVTGGTGDYYQGKDWYRCETKIDEGLVYFYDQQGKLLGAVPIEFVAENLELYGEPYSDPNEWKIYYDRLD